MNKIYLMIALLFSILSFQSSADMITWDLNCEQQGDPVDCVDNSNVWGTVTISDGADGAGGYVDVIIDIVDTARVQRFWLNFNEALFESGYFFEADLGTVSYTTDGEGLPANSPFAYFDLSDHGQSDFGFADPLTVSLGLFDADDNDAQIDLNYSDFNFLSEPGGDMTPLYAAVHIGACDNIFTCTGSIRVGAYEGQSCPAEVPDDECFCDDPANGDHPACDLTQTGLPEPQTLLILGSGLIGLFISRRRKMK